MLPGWVNEKFYFQQHCVPESNLRTGCGLNELVVLVSSVSGWHQGGSPGPSLNRLWCLKYGAEGGGRGWT